MAPEPGVPSAGKGRKRFRVGEPHRSQPAPTLTQGPRGPLALPRSTSAFASYPHPGRIMHAAAVQASSSPDRGPPHPGTATRSPPRPTVRSEPGPAAAPWRACPERIGLDRAHDLVGFPLTVERDRDRGQAHLPQLRLQPAQTLQVSQPGLELSRATIPHGGQGRPDPPRRSQSSPPALALASTPNRGQADVAPRPGR